MDSAIGQEHLILDLDKPRPKKPRGFRECPQCLLRIHTSLKRCICGHIFIQNRKIPQKYKNFVEIDWTEVAVKDKIYVENKNVWIHDQSVLEMGESGEYSVKDIMNVGLLLFGKNGFYFQDMINFGFSDKTGILRKKPCIYRFTYKRQK